MNPTDLGSPPPLRDRLLLVLRRHLSSINAVAVLRVAAQRAGVDAGALRELDAPAMVDAVRAGLPVFLHDAQACAATLSALDGLLSRRGGEPGAERVPASEKRAHSAPLVLEIATEDDVLLARDTVRQVCQELGFSAGMSLKVVTATSEIARNITMYARSGWMQIRRVSTPRAGVEITARDHGPGIANLNAIFEGRYRSKQGMGMGLRGARNLMDEMHVQSAPGTGTTVRMSKFCS